MSKNYHNYLFAIIVFASLFLQCNNNKSGGQEDHLTGLIFASKDELAGIPLASSPYGAGELPTSKDLSVDFPPVGDQGKQNSCVGWASAYALKSFQERVETKANLLFSPSFIYNQINNGQDGGARFIDALNLLSQHGAAKLDDMPYNETDYRTQPSQAAKENAKPFRIDYWRQVNVMDIKEVKAQVNAGYPVVIGASLDEGFKGGKTNGGNEYIWKGSSGNNIGGHAMLVVGYDDSRNAFKVMNSWGASWGNNGFCWIDYSFFPRAVKEGYVAKDAVTPTTETTTTTTPVDPNIVIPKYDPTEFKKAGFQNIQVLHNQTHPTYGVCMKIVGIADIPKGTGKTFQISTHFYLSNSTTQVGSLQSPQFADVNGYAATGTILYSIPEDGLNNWPFEIYMPYTAFNLTTGSYDAGGKYQYTRTYLYAIPTLFIDNFGYSKGEAINFYVDK